MRRVIAVDTSSRILDHLGPMLPHEETISGVLDVEAIEAQDGHDMHLLAS